MTNKRISKAVREQLLTARRAIDAVEKGRMNPLQAAMYFHYDVPTARRALVLACQEYGTSSVLRVLEAA